MNSVLGGDWEPLARQTAYDATPQNPNMRHNTHPLYYPPVKVTLPINENTANELGD